MACAESVRRASSADRRQAARGERRNLCPCRDAAPGSKRRRCECIPEAFSGKGSISTLLQVRSQRHAAEIAACAEPCDADNFTTEILAAEVLRDAAAECPTLTRCLHRLDELRRKKRSRGTRRWLAAVIFRLAKAPRLAGAPCGVRFVAFSDTHTHHDLIDLPAGEVLLYVGDSVGNYGRSCDLSKHYEDFLSWLLIQSRRFRHVFFIAGNHETFLDNEDGDITSGVKQLNKFLDTAGNCTYLQNEFATYRGLRLFGSPVTVSRMETEGKRYYSRAFEWPKQQRVSLWQGLPEQLDVLITHCPPRGRLSRRDVGCPGLMARITEMVTPPQYHVFGHDHEHLGAEGGERTTFLNVAQEELLHLDPGSGGCPLVFDVAPRSEEPP